MVRPMIDFRGGPGRLVGFDGDVHLDPSMTRGTPREYRGIDPISQAIIASAVLSSEFAIGTIGIGGLQMAASAITAAVGMGTMAALSALSAPSAARGVDPVAQQRTYDMEDGPRTVALGRARIGGTSFFRNSKDHDTYRGIARCQGEIDGIEEHYARDRAVTVDHDGLVSSPPYVHANGSYLHIKSKLGSEDQEAFQELIEAFPDQWTADHRLRGIVVTLARYISPGTDNPQFMRTWPRGFDDIELLVRGQKIFDPRASGQHYANPSSYRWSDNGPLCALWFLTAPEMNGGMGLGFERWDLDDIAIVANQADELLPSKSGQERRSVCSGSFNTATQRSEILADILASTGVRPVRLQNGKMSLRLESENPEISGTIEKDDIVDVVYGGADLVNDVNEFSLFYLSPERGWKMAELGIGAMDWSKDSQSIADSGKRPHSLRFNFCPQSGQAQRLARIAISRMRSPRGELTTWLGGLASSGGQFGTVELDELGDGFRPKVAFDGHEMISDVKVKVPVVFIEDLPPWDPDEHEVDAPVALKDVQFSGDIGRPEILAIAYVKFSDAESGIRIIHSEGESAVSYEATARHVVGGAVNPRQAMTEYGQINVAELVTPANQTYEVEVRGVGDEDDVSNWSEAKTLTTDAFNPAPLQGCSINVEHDRDEDVDIVTGIEHRRYFNIHCKCSDVRICKIADDYVRPNVTVTLSVYITGSGQSAPWDYGEVEGSVVFENSSGQQTILNYEGEGEVSNAA